MKTTLFIICLFSCFAVKAQSLNEEEKAPPKTDGKIPITATELDLSKIYGRIQIVDHFADYKVKIVESFGDLKVKIVESNANAPGKWIMVNSRPDFKIKIVNSFADFTIRYVERSPGVR